jgi:hypothetical protein
MMWVKNFGGEIMIIISVIGIEKTLLLKRRFGIRGWPIILILNVMS